jgi:hypothetical protein
MPQCRSCQLHKTCTSFYGKVSTRGICKVCKGMQSKRYRTATEHAFLRSLYSGCKMRHTRGKHSGKLVDWAEFCDVYTSQNGVCAETGRTLTTSGRDQISPDRVNNSAGYESKNVRFVTWDVNNARGSMNIEDFRCMCHDVCHLPRVKSANQASVHRVVGAIISWMRFSSRYLCIVGS